MIAEGYASRYETVSAIEDAAKNNRDFHRALLLFTLKKMKFYFNKTDTGVFNCGRYCPGCSYEVYDR